jgi:hypothetical protein
MQHVNDDMDEIFRRTGKDYPLDTSGADWDKIAAALQPGAVIVKKNDNRRYLWLLLLLPLPWICMKFTGSGDGDIAVSKPVKTEVDSNTEKQLPVQPNLDVQQAPSNDFPVEKKDFVVAGTNPHRQPASVRSQNLNTAQNHNGISWKTLQKLAPGTYTLENGKAITRQRDGSFIYMDNNTGKNTDATLPLENKTSGKEAKDALTKASVSIDNKKKVIREDSTVTKTASPVTETSLAKEKTAKQRKERFYLAPVAGFSVTSIKGQKLSDPGTDYGILAGIRVTPRIAVEAGVFSTRKNYYSEGSYYDKTRIYMPANSKLTTVSGDCRMVELPFSIRYDFSPVKRAHWFATAGVSNYLMKKENYDYTYYYYSTNYYYTYHKSYEKSSRDWMSVLQFSGGYNYSFRKGLRLRLEPYLQLPLKGVGYGNLPLTSYGFRLGIEKGFRF